jgi:thiol-disulfide isomerase/thioredoxin
MKKGLLVGIGVIALLALMVWADHRFPAAPRSDANTANTANAVSDAAIAKINIKNLNDQDVTLDQYKGKVVLVNFWATWCEPCQTEIPWLIEFQNKYGSRGFTILGVSMDEEGKKVIQPFLETQRFDVGGQKSAMNYPILLGNDSIADQFGGIFGMPTSMLFSRDGKKVKTIVGLALTHDQYAKAIEDLL